MKGSNVRLAARIAMQRHGYDPIDELVQMAQDANASSDLKKEVAQTLLPYMYPKLSSVTMDAEVTVNESAEASQSLMLKILESPELSDAAQKLSLAAADNLLSIDAAKGNGAEPFGPGLVN